MLITTTCGIRTNPLFSEVAVVLLDKSGNVQYSNGEFELTDVPPGRSVIVEMLKKFSTIRRWYRLGGRSVVSENPKTVR